MFQLFASTRSLSTPCQGRICRGLLAACGGPGYPSVCVLQDRAHASGRPDQRAQGACATPTTMSAPIRPTRNAPKRRLPARQRTGSSSVAPLTLKCASVIVIASIEERPRVQDDALRLCPTLIACPGGVGRLAGALTISIPPRPEYSGSVQPILSTVLTHAG